MLVACNLNTLPNSIDAIKKMIKDQSTFIEEEEHYVGDTGILSYLLVTLNLNHLYQKHLDHQVSDDNKSHDSNLLHKKR